MPKTLKMTRSPQIRTAAPQDRRGQRRALMLFLLAYIAILGVLFAPKGFFLESTPAPLVD